MKAKTSLSANQRALLRFLRSYIQEQGYPPSYREMAAALGFKSTNGVAYQLRCLEVKGYLERDSRGAPARALRLTARAGSGSDAQARAQTDENEALRVPLLGQVAAGFPAAAEELPDESILIDRGLCSASGGGIFALRVSGDSMVEDGILDGDLVFVRHQDQAHEGETVVAIVDGEATVKRFRRRADGVWLVPANRQMRPIAVSPDSSIIIAGVVVGVYRKLD